MDDLIVINNCKNCDEPIKDYNFCSNCGARKITKPITFKHLVSEFTERFLNIDNSFFKTCIHLFTKPEEVIQGYLSGLRKRYLAPFSYFAISVTISGIYSFIVKDHFLELLAMSSLSKSQLEAQQTGLETSFQYQSLISFLFIPILAIISRIVFLNYKKYNLTEHFIIYLYAYSHIVVFTTIFISLPITFLIDNFLIISFLPTTIYIVYIAYVLKRIYDINLRKIILKTLLFGLVGGVVFIILIMLIALSIFVTAGVPATS